MDDEVTNDGERIMMDDVIIDKKWKVWNRNDYRCSFSLKFPISNCYPMHDKLRILILLNLLLLPYWLSAQTEPERLRRSESFFGLHFDFHARATDEQVGETLTEAMLDSLLTIVQPDYIQVDCKGHPGIASYASKVSATVGSFEKDPLNLIREVTARHGVALYVHYSGVIDRYIADKHPEWASLSAEGQPNDRGGLSTYSPYVDQILIPQMKELSEVYDLDGAWIDGECWGLQPDYSEHMRQAWQTEHDGTLPKPEDENYQAFLEFNRQGFLKYLQHYLDEVHAFDPAFQMTSNWSYSSFMPEPVNTPVDYLSGDLTPSNAVYRASFESRCLAPQGKPWDIMAWSFAWGRELGNSTKTALQLQQEAAQVLSMGGGFQVYFKQNRDASFQPWTFSIMDEVAEFCREREEFTHKAQPVPQIALLYSNAGYKHISPNVYSPWSGELNPLQGILYALLDGQHSVEILRENHLSGKMEQYPLIVVPEWEYLEPAFRDELVNYTQKGGKLLVIGAQAVKLFEDELAVDFDGEVIDQQRQLGYKGHLAGLRTHFQLVKARSNTETLGQLYTLMDDRFPDDHTFASVNKLGEGMIGAVYADLGNVYNERKTTVYRDFLQGIVSRLFPDQMVEVGGSQKVQVAVNEKDDQLLINLVNTSGDHANEKVYVYDEIPKIGPLQVSARIKKKPAKVTLQPESQPVDFSYEDGVLHFQVPELYVHTIAIIE